jgi:hypothetical protein
MRGQRIVMAFSLMAALATAGCTTPPGYHPQENRGDTGYSDLQLSATRYRVVYTGEYALPRETVEDYLLRRAAEVTLKAGYKYFLFDTRDTQSKSMYRGEFDGPYFRGRYWHSWPMGPQEFSATAVQSYQAYAEIVLLTEAQAKNDPRALAAEEVLARLGA